jgi:hypothetical protein
MAEGIVGGKETTIKGYCKGSAGADGLTSIHIGSPRYLSSGSLGVFSGGERRSTLKRYTVLAASGASLCTTPLLADSVLAGYCPSVN